MKRFETKYKVITATTKSVEAGTEFPGAWPISTRVFKDFVTEDATGLHIDREVMMAIPSREVTFTDEETGRTETRTAPARDRLLLEDIVRLLESADDLAARAANGPWKTGKVTGKRAERLNAALDRAATAEQVTLATRYAMALNAAHGYHHWFMACPDMTAMIAALPYIHGEAPYRHFAETGRVPAEIDAGKDLSLPPEGTGYSPTSRPKGWKK